mgnify:FL=1
MTGTICGTGSCVPSFVMDNNDIAKLVDTSDEWIRERTGVVRRHIIREETTVSMAVQAGRQALENAGITADDVDLIIVSTISSNVILPCTACEVQKELGAKRATCFDLSAACSGFLFALHTAHAYICAGIYKNILLVGVEVLSKLIDWNDRSTCVLFGDGAGAAVLKSEDMRYYLPVTHSDGSKGEALCCRSRYDRSELSPEDLPKPDEKEYLMQMDGREVFMFAVKSVPQAVKEVVEKNNVAQEEISFYILHQANKRIVEAIAKRLGEPLEKFPMNLEEYGNTSSASIPILLDELNRAGKLNRGQKIILAGFGAGLTWGASILEW